MDDGNESQNGINKYGVESGRATSVLILDACAYPFESLLQLFAVIFQLGQVSAHRRSSSSPGRIGDNRRKPGPAAIDVAGSDVLLVMVLSPKSSAEVRVPNPAASRSCFKVAMFESKQSPHTQTTRC